MHRKTPEARRTPGWDPQATASHRLFAYKIPKPLKAEEPPTIFPETRLSSAAIENPNSGDRSLCSGTLPGRGSAPGAISIDCSAFVMLRE